MSENPLRRLERTLYNSKIAKFKGEMPKWGKILLYKDTKFYRQFYGGGKKCPPPTPTMQTSVKCCDFAELYLCYSFGSSDHDYIIFPKLLQMRSFQKQKLLFMVLSVEEKFPFQVSEKMLARIKAWPAH